MDVAFQSLLQKVGELGLNDGDFLKMNNLLKKAFDENKTAVEFIKLKKLELVFFHTISEDVVTIKYLETNYKNISEYYNASVLVSVKIAKYTAHKELIKMRSLDDYLETLITRFRPKEIQMHVGDTVTNYTYKNMVREKVMHNSYEIKYIKDCNGDGDDDLNLESFNYDYDNLITPYVKSFDKVIKKIIINESRE